MKFCGECIYYEGTERVPNPKTTSWMDSSRPKCVVDKSAKKIGYSCEHYEITERAKIFATRGCGALETEKSKKSIRNHGGVSAYICC